MAWVGIFEQLGVGDADGACCALAPPIDDVSTTAMAMAAATNSIMRLNALPPWVSLSLVYHSRTAAKASVEPLRAPPASNILRRDRQLRWVLAHSSIG